MVKNLLKNNQYPYWTQTNLRNEKSDGNASQGFHEKRVIFVDRKKGCGSYIL